MNCHRGQAKQSSVFEASSSSTRTATGTLTTTFCGRPVQLKCSAFRRQQASPISVPSLLPSACGRLARHSGLVLQQQSCSHAQSGISKRGSRMVARAGASILPLGFDLLTFLGSTVVVVPLFKRLQLSPVLGFLFSGIILHQFGLIRDPKDIEALSELGVLFLLFEMGLELSLDRLKALAKYAFGLGTLQMLLCTGIFTAFALPAGQGLGTHLLEQLAHASPSLVSIRSVDEAVVIGAALSLSSSAFVLQLLSERGETPTRFGSATLGILLLQDIAVVPFLVLLPLVVGMQADGGGGAGAAVAAAASNPASLVALLGPTVLKTVFGLGLLLVGGRLLLRRVFEVVAQSDNSETFVGLCLLTVAGAALLTEQLGFSDTMGAFTAGVLLSESSYKTQVEADIRPFRGLLLGLFFVTTGGSIDLNVLAANWQVIAWILAGLIVTKTTVVTALGPSFGLTWSESLRTGFMLSQGGEFAFVLLSLASSLHILPENLNQVLIIVVVLSMALTPGLAQAGKVAGDWVDENLVPRPAAGTPLLAERDEGTAAGGHGTFEEPVVICGFGPHGQMLATLLAQPLASLPNPEERAYIAFDLDPLRVQAARKAGFNVVYGDGTRAAVLRAAGVKKPRALAVCLTSNKLAAHKAVESLRVSYPTVPLYALGADIRDAAELERAGADRVVMSSTALGLRLGKEILQRLGASVSEANQVGKEINEAMILKAHSLADQVARYGDEALQDEAATLLGPAQYAEIYGNNNRKSSKAQTSSSGQPAAAPTSSSKSEKATVSSTMPSLGTVVDALPADIMAYNSAAAKAYSAGSTRNKNLSNGTSMDDDSSGSSTEERRKELEEAVDIQLSAVVEAGLMQTADKSSKKEKKDKKKEKEVLEPSQETVTASQPSKSSKSKANTISASATARLDCGDDETPCEVEEVANIVYIDADKQQLMSKQASGDDSAKRQQSVANSNGESVSDSSQEKEDSEKLKQEVRQPVSASVGGDK